MRIIEFRGKWGVGTWHYGAYLYDRIADKHYILTINPLGQIREIRVQPETVGQYIGREDLLGNKIYEGDITAYHHEHFGPFMPEETAKQKKVIVWKSNSKGIGFNLGTGEAAAVQRVVIGNIYDNPELV